MDHIVSDVDVQGQLVMAAGDEGCLYRKLGLCSIFSSLLPLKNPDKQSWPVIGHGLKNNLFTGFLSVETATALGQIRRKRASPPSCPSTPRPWLEQYNATIDILLAVNC